MLRVPRAYPKELSPAVTHSRSFISAGDFRATGGGTEAPTYTPAPCPVHRSAACHPSGCVASSGEFPRRRGCPLASVLGTWRCLAGGRAPPHHRARRRRSLCGLRPSSGIRRSRLPAGLRADDGGTAPRPFGLWSGDRDARSSAGRNDAADLALGEKSEGYGGLRPHQARFAPFGATRRKRTAPPSLRRCLTRASLRRGVQSRRGRGTADHARRWAARARNWHPRKTKARAPGASVLERPPCVGSPCPPHAFIWATWLPAPPSPNGSPPLLTPSVAKTSLNRRSRRSRRWRRSRSRPRSRRRP